MKEFIKKYDWIFYLCVLLIFVLNFFIPKAGSFSLLSGLIESIMILCIVIMLLISKPCKIYKSFRIFCFVIGSIIIVYFFKNVILDLVEGPKVVKLYDINISNNSGITTSLGPQYTLTGTDEDGMFYSLDIDSLKYGDYLVSATIEYYKNMDKAIRVYNIEESYDW